MALHKEHAHKEKHSAKPAGKDGLSGEEGKIAGISKTRRRLRRVKLAAKAAVATVAIAAGLAAATLPSNASARAMTSIRGASNIQSYFEVRKIPGEHVVNLPGEFAEFAEGQSTKERLETLSKSLLFQRNFAERDGLFAIKSSGGDVAFIVTNSTVVVFGDGKKLSFTLDISQYEMENPVPRLEETKDGRVILHLIDVATGTDLTLTFNMFSPSIKHMKAKAFREKGAVSQDPAVARAISEVINAGEASLQAANPKSVEEAHEAYSVMGAEMVNKLNELCAALPPQQAEALAVRGQAVITAVLLRLYLSDDEEALTQLDKLRANPRLNEKMLEDFAWRNGILDEFQQIWGQCRADVAEQ